MRRRRRRKGGAGRGPRLTRFVFASAGRRKVFAAGGRLRRGKSYRAGGARARPPGLSRRRRVEKREGLRGGPPPMRSHLRRG